jgi:hypothetical protein
LVVGRRATGGKVEAAADADNEGSLGLTIGLGRGVFRKARHPVMGGDDAHLGGAGGETFPEAATDVVVERLPFKQHPPGMKHPL